MQFIGKKESIFVAKKMRDELIYNMAKSEGNTLSFAETSSVVRGISVGGKKMKELHQIERIRDGWDEIIQQCLLGKFEVTKENFIFINTIVADTENPELGNFRTKPVFIGGTKWQPPLPMLLSENFRNMINDFNNTSDISAKSFGLFLDSARNQFFADGNKRTSQLIANGYLITNGYSLFSIDESMDIEYKEKLIEYYESGNKEAMLDFLGKHQTQKDLDINSILSEYKNSAQTIQDEDIYPTINI